MPSIWRLLYIFIRFFHQSFSKSANPTLYCMQKRTPGTPSPIGSLSLVFTTKTISLAPSLPTCLGDTNPRLLFRTELVRHAGAWISNGKRAWKELIILLPTNTRCDCCSTQVDSKPAMTKCARCCLHNSMKIVNLIMLVYGIGMIIYSLWLEKKWDEGIAKFPHGRSPLKPWFIFTFLGVGMAVCLSTIGGYIIANRISNSTICFYIVATCCLLFLEVAVVVAIFFKIDWGKKIAAYIGQKNTDFEKFALIQVKMSRGITLLILVAQISVVILAAILWAVGTEARTHFHWVNIPVFTQSFLVPAVSPEFAESSIQVCRRCGTILRGENAPISFLSRIKSVVRRRFQRTNIVY